MRRHIPFGRPYSRACIRREMVGRCDQMFGSDGSRMTRDPDRHRVVVDCKRLWDGFLAKDVCTAKYSACTGSLVSAFPRPYEEEVVGGHTDRIPELSLQHLHIAQLKILHSHTSLLTLYTS
jgi:hypothetical protein